MSKLKHGKIIAVRGIVVDVNFDNNIPPLFSLLKNGLQHEVVIEVMAQQGMNIVSGAWL